MASTAGPKVENPLNACSSTEGYASFRAPTSFHSRSTPSPSRATSEFLRWFSFRPRERARLVPLSGIPATRPLRLRPANSRAHCRGDRAMGRRKCRRSNKVLPRVSPAVLRVRLSRTGEKSDPAHAGCYRVDRSPSWKRGDRDDQSCQTKRGDSSVADPRCRRASRIAKLPRPPAEPAVARTSPPSTRLAQRFHFDSSLVVI